LRTIVELLLLASAMLFASVPSTSGATTWGLYFKVDPVSPLVQGTSNTLVASFTNTGQVPLRIDGVIVYLDFGSFSPTSGLPLYVPISTGYTVNIPVQIPMTASAGNHTGAAEVNFEYQDPSSLQWTGEIHTWTGSVQVEQSWIIPILIGIVIVAVITAVTSYVILTHAKRKEKLEEMADSVGTV